MENYFMKKPCQHCPYRRDVKPFLHPERGAELAYLTQNPYNEFHCHKTTVSDEEFGGEGEDMVVVSSSKICAGFLTMQVNYNGNFPDGFIPDENIYENIYEDSWEMIDAYEEENLR